MIVEIETMENLFNKKVLYCVYAQLASVLLRRRRRKQTQTRTQGNAEEEREKLVLNFEACCLATESYVIFFILHKGLRLRYDDHHHSYKKKVE
jgi:hypothetical protein